MKYLFVFALLLSACTSTPRYVDRTEQQKEYAEDEAQNQARSLTRSEWMAKVSALQFQIKAIDSQIENQRSVITRWKSQAQVASSQAMIENANVRIRHLKEERVALEAQKKDAEEELQGI